MKTTFLSIFIIAFIALSNILFSENNPDKAGCDCAGAVTTIEACFTTNCIGPVPPPTPVTLYDVTCGQTAGSCTLTTATPCCTLTTSGCSDHRYIAIYTIGGNTCTTASFSGSTSPVIIPCTCP